MKAVVQKILTHHSPDLDAMLAVLLMRRFGNAFFPGAGEAEVIFAPAGQLPDNKTAWELEEEGILALDIGGGRFDTHPVDGSSDNQKRDRSASDLVAEALQMLEHPSWRELIEYTRLHDTSIHSLYSKDFLHHLVSLHTILLGLQLQYVQDSTTKLEKGILILDNIPFYAANPVLERSIYQILIQLIERYLAAHNVDIEEEKKDHWQNIITWYQRLQNQPDNAFSGKQADQIASLKSIIIGAYQKYEGDMEQVYLIFQTCLDAILKREFNWFNALEEFQEKAVVKRIRKADIVSIESSNGMVIKVSRFKSKGDLVVYRNPSNGATSILIKRRGPLNKMSFERLAEKVRLVEAESRNELPQYDLLRDHGEVHAWFLHQSGNILLNGSPKSPNFEKSLLSLETLRQIVYSEVDWSWEIPRKLKRTFTKLRRRNY